MVRTTPSNSGTSPRVIRAPAAPSRSTAASKAGTMPSSQPSRTSVVGDMQSFVAEARAGELGRGHVGQDAKEQGAVLDRPAERADRVEAGRERQDAVERDQPGCRLQPDQVVPAGRDAHRAAGVRADPGGGEAELRRNRRARARPAGRAVGLDGVRRRARHRVHAEAGEGELGGVRLAEADRAGRGAAPHAPARRARARGRRAGASRPRSRRPRCRTGPSTRSARRRAARRACPRGAPGGRRGLGPGALGRRAGIDRVARRMAVDRVEESLGQLARVDPARADGAAERRGRLLSASP